MKKCNKWIINAAAVAALMSCGTSFGDGILDQQLGLTPTEAKKAAPDAVPTPAPKTDDKKAVGPAVAPELVDPNAAKVIDDMDLVKKLTNAGASGATGDVSGPDAAMKNMIDHMGQSQTRLTGKDTGAVTQEMQRRITMDLDVMIEYARQQQQKGPSQNKQDEQKGDKRQQSGDQKQGGHGKNQGGTQSATSEQLPGGGSMTPESNGQDMRQKGPSEWGGLPGKDRDLVSNGVNEQYLPAYKEMIDRYYQALAEIGKTKDH